MTRAGKATKRIGPMVDLLICVVFVVCPILASTNANKREHGNAYAKKTEDDSRLSKNSKEPKLSTHRNENNDLLTKEGTRSTKASNDNSALGKFLEDVLRAQDDLKWIDQAVRGVNLRKDWEKLSSTAASKNSESSHREKISLSMNADHDNKPREKRGFDQNYEDLWANKQKDQNKDSPEMPQRVYLESDIPLKNEIEFGDVDSMNGKEVSSSLKNKLSRPVYEKGTIDDQIPKDWTKTEDICSLSDWLNSNKEPETAHEKQGDRWIRDFEASQGDRPSADEKVHARYNVRSPRDEAKKDEAPTLESLKQTVLQLKKSLNEADIEHESSKNVNSVKEETKDQKSHDKNKRRDDQKDDEDESNWREEPSHSEDFDLKKREQTARDLDKNAPLKVWRTKRTEEVNNDDGNLKLFHRAGFGEPYLEEKALKELHDRKRRSKGIPPDEKRYSNEPLEKNNLEAAEKNSNELSKGSSCNNIDDSSKQLSSNDLQRKMTNDIDQPDQIRKDLNTVENKVTKDDGKGENLENNPLQNCGSTTNDLQASFAKASSDLKPGEKVDSTESRMKKVEENQEDVESDKGEQLIKVSEPQARLYQNDGRAKGAQGLVPDEEDHGKLPQQLSEEKRSANEPGNINILLKSVNKNLIQLSNAGNSEQFSKSGGRQPFVINRFDVKKKLIMENEENPGKSVSTIFNLKIEKAQMDRDMKVDKKREDIKRGVEDPIFDVGMNKPNEELYKDTPELTSDLKQRNLDKEQLKNSMEFDKGSAQSGGNEGGRNWYEGVVRNQMGTSIDQSGAEKYKEEGEKDKFENEEVRFRENKKKGGSMEDSNDRMSFNEETSPCQDDKLKNDDDKNKLKYRQIFIVTNGMDDRKLNDRYVQRKILQYMEYSNDDVEDADANYGDKEEEENQQQAEAAGNNIPVRRKERSNSKGNPVKAKLNVMIKNKIDEKEKKSRRKRREPDVIEYYDYDTDMEQGDHDAVSAARDQEPIDRDENAIEANLGLAESQKGTQACPPFALKKGKNLQEEEVLKQQRENEKLHNKAPQQQFIETIGKTRSKNVNGKPRKQGTDSSRLSSKVTLAEEEGPSISNQQPGRLNQPPEREEGKLSAVADARETIAENPQECVPSNYLDSGVIDGFLEDIQLMDQKNEKLAPNVEPLYEELKKLYDWSDSEWKSKPRIKGDQRMYYGVDDKVDSMNTLDEPFKDQMESPEIQSQSESSDSSPNLLPLLLAQSGQESSEIGVKPNPAASSERLERPGASNLSQSNYFALKSTDDMFKGGSEQSNRTEEKLRGASPIGAAVQRPTQKVNGMRNDAAAEKYPASWSLTDQRQYVDTDSRSPYENRKYLESQQPRERVQNTDREKQMVVSSRDLHESFVEPLDWIDDFDKDIRVRLSRGLKTVENMNSDPLKNMRIHVIPNITKNEDHKQEKSSTSTCEEASTETAEITSASGSSAVGLIGYSSSNLQNLPGTDNIRIKRRTDDSYETFYDDMNEHQRDSDKMDYGRYSKNTEALDNRYQLLNSYEDVDDIRDRFSKSNTKNKEQDSPEEEDEDIDYTKVARSPSFKGSKHKKKKHYGNSLKKKKRKGHKGKAKYSSNNRKKRRNHKKHSDPKTKNHEYDQKKHKKRTSKGGNRHTSVKKSKAPQAEEKAREAHREPSTRAGKAAREKMESEDTMNPDGDFHGKGISMLLAADNIEDESQMDSALHGELAGKIVEHIFEQVQSKENLKVSLGPGLYQKHKTEESIAANKRFRQSINDDEIKHTEELLERIMLLLNQLIFDEVQRKTCVSLPSDLVDFLDWMLDVNPQETLIEQVPSLPLVHEESTPAHFPRDKFLFQGLSDQGMGTDIVELRKKLRLIESLIREYGALSEKEKTKVQSVHDYLAKQLDLLLEYIEGKEEAGKKGKSSPSMGPARAPTGRILQYQTGMRNATNGSYLRGPDNFSPFVNVPHFSEMSNTNILKDGDYFRDNSINLRHKRHRTVRSLDNQAKKHRKRRKRKKKHRKRHKGTVHNAAASRHKRGYLDKDFWDSLDSGYEKPLIYSSMDMSNLKSNGNDGKLHTEKNNCGDTQEKPRYWKDVPIEGIDQSYLTKWNSEIDGEKDNDLSSTNNYLRKRETLGVTKALSASVSQHANKAATAMETKESVSNLNRENNPNRNDKDLVMTEEEPITGKNRLEDEVILLNKRQAWKKENEEQLEEVAFGEDMRKGMGEKELFEKLTEMDKKKSASESSERSKRKDKKVGDDVPLISWSTRQGNDLREKRGQNYGFNDCAATDRNNGSNLSSEDKLKMLEAKINVYADNDADTRRDG